MVGVAVALAAFAYLLAVSFTGGGVGATSISPGSCSQRDGNTIRIAQAPVPGVPHDAGTYEAAAASDGRVWTGVEAADGSEEPSDTTFVYRWGTSGDSDRIGSGDIFIIEEPGLRDGDPWGTREEFAFTLEYESRIVLICSMRWDR